MTLEQLHELQCMVEGVEKEVLWNQSRKRLYVRYRTAFCVVARELGHTYQDIGRYLGGKNKEQAKDHSTVIHSIRSYEREGDGIERQMVTKMIDRLTGRAVSTKAPSHWIFPGVYKYKNTAISLRSGSRMNDSPLSKLSPGMKRVYDALLEEPKAGYQRLRNLTGLTISTIKIYKRQLKPFL